MYIYIYMIDLCTYSSQMEIPDVTSLGLFPEECGLHPCTDESVGAECSETLTLSVWVEFPMLPI